jgi:hypothetical protein
MHEKPHPLVLRLIDQARDADTERFALLLGAGSGRNIPPLLDARFRVDILEENQQCAASIEERFKGNATMRITQGSYTRPEIFHTHYHAVLSTHALLHGSPATIVDTIHALAAMLPAGADMMLTLGSTRDPRFGTGRRIDARTWAPTAGDEENVPHVYYDEEEARKLLRSFSIISLEETQARAIVGAWAHDTTRTPEIIHWFVHAKR